MCLVCMGGVSVDEIIVWNNFKFHLEARATTKLRWGGAAVEWGCWGGVSTEYMYVDIVGNTNFVVFNA